MVISFVWLCNCSINNGNTEALPQCHEMNFKPASFPKCIVSATLCVIAICYILVCANYFKATINLAYILKKCFRKLCRRNVNSEVSRCCDVLNTYFHHRKVGYFWNVIKRRLQTKCNSFLSLWQFSEFYSNHMQDDPISSLSSEHSKIHSNVQSFYKENESYIFPCSITPEQVD